MPDLFTLPFITASIVLVILALVYFLRDLPKTWPLILFAVTCLVISPLAYVSYAKEVAAADWISSLDHKSSHRALTEEELASFGDSASDGRVYRSEDGARRLYCVSFSDGSRVAALEMGKGGKREMLQGPEPC